MSIAQESNITFYDAVFISLAQSLRADLITDNYKHQSKYTGKDVRIIPLKEYATVML